MAGSERATAGSSGTTTISGTGIQAAVVISGEFAERQITTGPGTASIVSATVASVPESTHERGHAPPHTTIEQQEA
ncbi:MAG: hypothetical protein WBL23_01525 [Salinisphaera sp.]|uniref:hypothetical protein n=1 Tax=Salinisphaera sp. TaxID=1914330 RepID=UPI003C7AC487